VIIPVAATEVQSPLVGPEDQVVASKKAMSSGMASVGNPEQQWLDCWPKRGFQLEISVFVP